MKDSCTHHLLPGTLTSEEIQALKAVCQEALTPDAARSSYIFLDRQEHPVYQKIKLFIEDYFKSDVFYLNDFYFYTDESFLADWHVDTEMFAFERAVNVWILLAPDAVKGPLAFIHQTNQDKDSFYHTLRMDGNVCNFVNFTNYKNCEYPVDQIEENRIDTPEVKAGDILLINPKRFHRTASATPKHALVFKFVIPDGDGFRAQMPVPDVIWPEVAVFDDIIRDPNDWSKSLNAIRQKLADPDTLPVMTEGFFPEKLPLFKAKVKAL